MLKKFFVKNLFQTFDSEINFRDDGITIVVGQNGSGKTTVLRMISILFSQNHELLLGYDFDYIECEIDDNIIKVEKFIKTIEDDEEDDLHQVCLKYFIDGKYIGDYKNNSRINSPLFWSNNIPSLRRKTRDTLVDTQSNEVLRISEVISKYYDELDDELKEQVFPIPNEVYNILKKVSVELITTDRLKLECQNAESIRTTWKYAVEECSLELKNKIKNCLSEYANIAQILDEKFPFKVIKSIEDKKCFSIDELKQNIENTSSLREKHINSGILEDNKGDSLSGKFEIEQLDIKTSTILYEYYLDLKIKMESLNDISDRIILFKSIINNKLSNKKEVLVDKENGISIIQKSKDYKINLKDLSSGEQHEIVLLYNLIFKGRENKCVLLDEPEISLNVRWQRDFIEDIKKIISINNIAILVATHSPQIINDNWDLVEELGEFD
ncbi:MAG: AAA family ATPase [Erysipelotrichales bacterium]|nr:AAA family ATPase [Erysipelotrichales bacterium]